jgi:hypothetical protein
MKWLLAAVGAAAVAIVPPSATSHPDYGVVTSIQFLDGFTLQRLRELGVGAVRIDLDWSLLEPVQGRFDLGDPRVNFWIDQARAAGLHVFATLEHPPLWAAPCSSCMPYDLWDWYAYVRHVIARFAYLGPDITFGIWNEPNLTKFLAPSSPDLYGDLFDYANLARLDANPSARLAGPETEFGAETSGFFAAALARMRPDLRPQDVITVHWYPGTRSPDLLDYMQRILSRAGTREVWLSETGEKNPDDVLQLTRLQGIVNVFNHRPWTQWSKLFVYRLYGGDPADDEAPLNLVRPDFSIRPAFEGYRSIMYRIFTVGLIAANGRYVRSDPNAAPSLRASSDSVGPGETFQIYDFNGGALQSGDLVRIQTADGTYLRVPGRNRPLLADDSCGCHDDGLFVVGSAGVNDEEGRLTLKSYTTGQYASLDAGRAADIFVNRGFAGPRETFTVDVR